MWSIVKRDFFCHRSGELAIIFTSDAPVTIKKSSFTEGHIFFQHVLTGY